MVAWEVLAVIYCLLAVHPSYSIIKALYSHHSQVHVVFNVLYKSLYSINKILKAWAFN